MGVSNQLRPALVFQNKHFSVFVRHISASDLMRPCSTSIKQERGHEGLRDPTDTIVHGRGGRHGGHPVAQGRGQIGIRIIGTQSVLVPWLGASLPDFPPSQEGCTKVPSVH